MRRFFQMLIKPFKKAWVWYLILLLVLSALVWFVGPVVYLTSVSWRLCIILVLVVAWALNAMRLQRKKLQAEHAAATAPDDSIDHVLLEKSIADLQGKYRRALHTVAQRNPWTLFLTFKRNQLPWYLVLGSQGSGKTTLLTESGLHFPLGNDALADAKDKPEELIRWRFAKEAIFIDADGSLATFTDKQSLIGQVWEELLNLMAWHKIRKQLNGIIMTVSLQELLGQTSQQRQQLAHALRTRLSDIEDALGVKYPVYVQITKTDVLAGFKEFFEKLTEQERNQVWGMTFPDRADQDVVQLFPQEFDALITRLNDYLLPRLQETNSPDKAALITMFASQLMNSKSVLQSFLSQTFESNHYQERGYLRGVYFTSVRQTGRPMNRLLLSESKALGLHQGLAPLDEQYNSTYFVFNIFRDIIFQEKHLLQMSTNQARKTNLHRNTSYIVIGVLALGMVYVWANSFVLNHIKMRELNATAKDYMANYEAYYTGQNDIPPSLSELYTLRHTFDDNTDPHSMHWGLYQGYRFSDQISQVYLRQLERQFVPLLQQTVEEQLQQNMNDPANLYNFLRVYLMLADPSRIDAPFITSWMKMYWQQALPSQDVLQATLDENLQDYLTLNQKGIKMNQPLVDQARSMLIHTSPAQRVYFELEKDATTDQVSISNEFDSDFAQVFGQASLDLTISRLYTKQGYNDIYKANINSLIADASDSNWILGTSQSQTNFTSDEIASIKRYVDTMYMQNYTNAWLNLLAKFQVRQFDNLQDAENVLALLSQPTSPLKQVLDQVYKNTVLEKGDLVAAAVARRQGVSTASLAPKSASAAKSAVSKSGVTSAVNKLTQSLFTGSSSAKTTAVGATFYQLNMIVQSSQAQPAAGAAGQVGGQGDQTSPYGNIQAAIGNLDSYVQDILSASNPDRAAYEAAVEHLQGKGDDPISKLIAIANNSPEPLADWLNSLAQNTWAAELAAAKSYISDAWQQNVWPVYQQTLQDKYPLYADARDDVSMADFSNFFAPGGVFDQFYQTYLAPFIDDSSARWTVAVVDGAGLPLSSAEVQQLQAANQVQQAFFGNNKQVSVAFTVQPIDLSAQAGGSELTIEGVNIDYSHGPIQSTNVVWPSANPTESASLSIYTIGGAQQTITTSGDWAWLKLLDKAHIQHGSGNSAINAYFTINNNQVSYSISVKNRYNPFIMDLLHSVDLKQTL